MTHLNQMHVRGLITIVVNQFYFAREVIRNVNMVECVCTRV